MTVNVRRVGNKCTRSVRRLYRTRAFLAIGVVAGLAVTVTAARLSAQGTPSPLDLGVDSITDPVNQADLLRRYARLLHFDSGVPGSDDEQYIDVIRPRRPGEQRGRRTFDCRARIWPEPSAHRNDSTAYRRPRDGGGRITARIQLHPGCRRADGHDGYGKYDLFPIGYSYVWIDSYDPQGNAEWGKARAIIVPRDHRLALIVRDSIAICKHEDYEDAYATARWVHQPNDAGAWWTCMRTGCCNLDP
jgi:hypothetical protein